MKEEPTAGGGKSNFCFCCCCSSAFRASRKSRYGLSRDFHNRYVLRFGGLYRAGWGRDALTSRSRARTRGRMHAHVHRLAVLRERLQLPQPPRPGTGIGGSEGFVMTIPRASPVHAAGPVRTHIRRAARWWMEVALRGLRVQLRAQPRTLPERMTRHSSPSHLQACTAQSSRMSCMPAAGSCPRQAALRMPAAGSCPRQATLR